MSKLVNLIKTGVLDISVSAGVSFFKYAGIEPKHLPPPSWFLLRDILKDLPDSIDEEEMIEEIFSTLKRFISENDELMDDHFRESKNEKSSEVIKESPRGYVYLMRNSRNGYIKIGFTKGYPTYRESTLQSQEPEVELINHWKGSMDDEQQLHSMFNEKRIRGEWFSLDPEDLSKVDEYFSLRTRQ